MKQEIFFNTTPRNLKDYRLQCVLHVYVEHHSGVQSWIKMLKREKKNTMLVVWPLGLRFLRASTWTVSQGAGIPVI